MVMPFILRRTRKVKSLRIINLLGLSLLFACIFVSYSYITRELSYDKFYTNSEKIARLSLSFDGNQADGRIYGDIYDPLLDKCPEIEDILKFSKILASTLIHNDKKYAANDILLANDNFFSFFDTPFLQGDTHTAFNEKGKIVISEKLAKELFGKTTVVGEKIQLSSRNYAAKEGFISGVYKDFPPNSHIHSDIIICEDDFSNLYYYTYLMLKAGNDSDALASKITNMIQTEIDNPNAKTGIAEIMPLNDIHLHSHILRELEPNGNIDYIYLIAGANILLSVIVFFNLWLNSNVIFSYNKRYYQLLRLNGASPFTVIKDESNIALLIGSISLIFALLISGYAITQLGLSEHQIPVIDKISLPLILLACTITVSLLPVVRSMAVTAFNNRNNDLKATRFSISNVKYMLVVQYAIVIFIIIVAAGIRGQMSVIKTNQIGAENDSIVVLKEQPQEVIDRYAILKQELLKHPEIEMVTAAMQLPGGAVRDGITVRKETGGADPLPCPLLVVGEDFFPFFNIKPIAGSLPPPLTLTAQEEYNLLMDKFAGKEVKSTVRDSYIINRKALQLFGYSTPEEAIGKELIIEHGSVDYIPSGRIAGVVEDFVYSNVFEETSPLLIMQRSMFMNCFMLRLSPDNRKEALNILNNAWAKVNPDFPLDYSFLQDSYGMIYRNEINAEKIVNLFSGLCLIITILGLIVFMAFMIKTRTKEIGIRKVNGASNKEIIYLLNRNLFIWIIFAFIIAVPLSKYVIMIWLENFAYKTHLHWWLFAGTGIFVILLSIIAVSWQSWRAARVNPVESIKCD